MMELAFFNPETLAAFVASEPFRRLETLPISRHRARSHCQNPRAAAADVLLIVAFREGRIVGYLGILPDWFFEENDRPQRVGWLSCLWVSPGERGAGLAGKLMQAALEKWPGGVLSADYVPSTKKIYDKTDAFAPEPVVREGLKFYLRSDLARILPPKRAVFTTLRPLLSLADRLANAVLDLRFVFGPKNPSGDFQVQKVERLDEETAEFLAPFLPAERFRRSLAEWNWMLETPWISSGPADADSRRYYFSSLARHFSFNAFKVFGPGEKMVAFLVCSRRNGAVKTPCCFVAEGAAGAVGALVLFHLRAWRATEFLTFHPELGTWLANNAGATALFQKQARRYFLATKNLRDMLASGRLQDGDGDLAFT